MKNKLFIAIFTVFILAVFLSAPLSYVLSKNGIISVANVGNIIKPDKTYEGDSTYAKVFTSIEEGKRVVNDIYINYIPGYVPITSSVTSAMSKINTPVTDMFGRWGESILLKKTETDDGPQITDDETGTDTTDPTDTTPETVNPETLVDFRYSSSLLKSDDQHRFYRVNAEGDNGDKFEFLCRVPSPSRKRLERSMKAQYELINSMADARTDVNLYVYIPTCLEDTALGEKILPTESTKELFDTFVSSMSENVNIDYLKIDTVYDKVNKYFLTDHHWNRYGSYEGYLSIIDMMKKNHTDFGEAREIVKDWNFGIPLYGSLDLAVNNYSLSDEFGVLDLGLPDHTLKINRKVPYGGKKEFNSLLETYSAGKQNKSKSYNHFMNFYRIAEEIVYPENNTGRNLLFIGDSFSSCVAEALASHFDKTIVRYVDSTEPPEINYSDYIDENKITDVVILETSSRVVLNLYKDALNNITVGGNGK